MSLLWVAMPFLGGCRDGGAAGTLGRGDSAGSPGGSDTGSAECPGVDAATEPLYLAYVIHNEEDDAGGIPSSSAGIPDYNGDRAVFEHFSGAMMDYAVLLSERGATLSFQPDWTFVEGAEQWWPTFFAELRGLEGVEVLPHAHESFVAYDDLYLRLEALGAEPEPILGGMTFDEYLTRQDWFAAHPEFTFWDGPRATVSHTDDIAMPPVVYRVPMPAGVVEGEDLYRHDATSSVIVSPGLELVRDRAEIVGRYLVPRWQFRATREFLAEPDDDSVPEEWRAGSGGLPAAAVLELTRMQLDDELLPLVASGQARFVTVAELTALYLEHEACLDLVDGQDLSGLVGHDLP